jgi:hypothetical protein
MAIFNDIDALSELDTVRYRNFRLWLQCQYRLINRLIQQVQFQRNARLGYAYYVYADMREFSF